MALVLGIGIAPMATVAGNSIGAGDPSQPRKQALAPENEVRLQMRNRLLWPRGNQSKKRWETCVCWRVSPTFSFHFPRLCCNTEQGGKETETKLGTFSGLGGLSQLIPDWPHFIRHLHVRTPSQSHSSGSLYKTRHSPPSSVNCPVGEQLSWQTAPRTSLPRGQSHWKLTTGTLPLLFQAENLFLLLRLVFPLSL